ncbi:MAG: hypothetical protein ABI867_34105 [Kofleriaceae bacterium]
MKTLRRLKALAPRQLRRRDFDFTDATTEPQPEPPPEAVFDRVTGPYGRRYGLDEET